MKSSWLKLGKLYNLPDKPVHPKLFSHAANPLAVYLEGDVYRIFFSARDEQNRSSVGAVDIDIVKRHIIQEFPTPFIEHGKKGSFFADGISIGNCYEVKGERYILFMGWNNPPDEHWHGAIGRLHLRDDLTLELDSNKPFLDLDKTDPISLSYPWVMGDENSGFQMWYGSTVTWQAENSEMIHIINYASSKDGHHWVREGLSVPYSLNEAQAFSRPTVIYDQASGYHMWVSIRSGRGEKYRIAYAKSENGKKWKLDNAGIDVSPEGWDSEMLEYPFVFRHKDHYYMLYNGNDYGRSGFGLAVLDNAQGLKD